MANGMRKLTYVKVFAHSWVWRCSVREDWHSCKWIDADWNSALNPLAVGMARVRLAQTGSCVQMVEVEVQVSSRWKALECPSERFRMDLV